jgi:hypothetical protein
MLTEFHYLPKQLSKKANDNKLRQMVDETKTGISESFDDTSVTL